MGSKVRKGSNPEWRYMLEKQSLPGERNAKAAMEICDGDVQFTNSIGASSQIIVNPNCVNSCVDEN